MFGGHDGGGGVWSSVHILGSKLAIGQTAKLVGSLCDCCYAHQALSCIRAYSRTSCYVLCAADNWRILQVSSLANLNFPI